MATSSKTAMRWLERKVLYSAGFGIVLMLAIGVGLYFYLDIGNVRPDVIRIGYGAGGPVRRHFLEQMALHGKPMNLDIQLVITEGTAETVEKVENGEIELGLVTGAIEDQHTDKLLELAPLYMESLQLLVKEDLFDAVSKDFGQLRGKTINLDGRRSATNLVATELLTFIGLIDASGTPGYEPRYMQQGELVAVTDSSQLPDAIFQIGGLPSQTVRQMIIRHNYRLVQLPFGASFNLEKFRAEDRPAMPSNELRVDRAFIEEFVIPAYSYSVLPPVPPVDTRTIASRLLLLAGTDFDKATAIKVVELLMSPEISDLVRPQLTPELLKHAFQFERHPGTQAYLDALEPIDVESAFVNYGRLVEVWGLIIAAYVTVAQGLKKWRQRKAPAHKSVNDFLKDVLDVEADAAPGCTADERTQLDQRLTAIKKAAIDMQLEGTLDDGESLQALLVAVADARTRIWGPR